MTDELVAWLGDEQAGHLRRDRTGFRCHPADDGPSITVATAAADRPWGRGLTRAWFDGLLPEGERRDRAEADHGVERGDSFGLLAAIGWECAGAVATLPPGRDPDDGWYRHLDEAEVDGRLDTLPRAVPGDIEAVRLSLGGVQDKLLLARDGSGWVLPVEGAPSTMILKPEPPAYPGLVAAEAWCLSLAATVTRAASARTMATTSGRPVLVVA